MLEIVRVTIQKHEGSTFNWPPICSFGDSRLVVKYSSVKELANNFLIKTK